MNNSPSHSDPETELERRLALAKSYQTKEELHDSIEDDPEFEEILDKASKEAAAHFSPEDRGIGFCHQVWKKKTEILEEKYGVLWFSPSDMNPGWFYD